MGIIERINSEEEPELWIPETPEQYDELESWLYSLKEKKQFSEWEDAMRWYGRNDLFFLHRYIVSLGGAIHSTYGTFLYHHQLYIDAARKYERQLTYGSSLDCSARRSGKSEMRSCSMPIFLALNYPDIAIFFFSVEKALAQKHLLRVAGELTKNNLLKNLYPEILSEDPREDKGTMWSKTDGLCIKGRTVNRSIQTFEAHALFGGGPIGTGPDVIIADDIERSDKVATPEAIADLDRAFSEAVSLLTPVVVRKPILIISNTRFAKNGLIQRTFDKYSALNEDRVREYPAEDLAREGDGPLGGYVNYPYTSEFLTDKFENQESKEEYALQYALDYSAASERQLKREGIIWYKENPREKTKEMNVVICVDASRGITDPTAIVVWGIDAYEKKHLVDIVVKKMDPTTQFFFDTLFNVISLWTYLSAGVVQIRVEDTANSTWTELITSELQKRGYYANIPIKVKVHARQMSGKFKSGKADRIYSAWNPPLSRGELLFPELQRKGGPGIRCENEKGVSFDAMQYFMDVEWDAFPRGAHDDILDSGGLLFDNKTNEEHPIPKPALTAFSINRTRLPYSTSWMSAGG